jgi:hypothetical protein
MAIVLGKSDVSGTPTDCFRIVRHLAVIWITSTSRVVVIYRVWRGDRQIN